MLAIAFRQRGFIRCTGWGYGFYAVSVQLKALVNGAEGFKLHASMAMVNGSLILKVGQLIVLYSHAPTR